MAREYVFLVHGIGKHDPSTWSDPWQDAIVTALQNYAEFRDMDAATIERDHIAFVPIHYDTIFEEGYRKRWGDLANAIVNQDGLVPADVAGVLSSLRDDLQSDEQQVLWDHILDVVLWFGVPQARQAVIAEVNAQLSAAVNRMRNENGDLGRAHLIAHSLGTSVIHDSILCLSAAEPAFAGKNFKWRTLAMIANTSRVMQAWMHLSSELEIDDFDVHNSNVQPGSARKFVVRRYLNVRNIADPVTWPREFDPSGWDENTYKTIDLKRYGALTKVHDFTTYFANPNAHVPILRSILGRGGLGSRDERDAAWRRFDTMYPSTAGSEFADLRAIVQRDSAREHSLFDLVLFLVKTYREFQT